MNLNMTSVESVVAQIQGLSSSVDDLNHLHNFLKQSDDLLQSESTHLASCLAELDPSKHSLGYLYILEACTSAPISKEQANELILTIARFINDCVAVQIRLAPDKFISVCKNAIKLVFAFWRMIYMRLISQGTFFLYCYYGGMICIGQKRFRKALELLHNVVTAPMSTINAIAVEAYKKYILVSLIHLGQFSASFPKYTSSAAQRNLKNFSQPYIELANSYSTGIISELEAYVQTNREKFETDNNLGLVKQVVSSMYKRNIQRLTQTYLTLSLQDIASTVQLNNPKEAEMHVLQMIQDGEIYATINQKDGMVRFLEDPEQYKTCEMIEHIDSSIQRIMTLSKKLTAMDELISCDPLYLAKVGRERQRFDFDDFDTVPQKFNI
ncbi:hypothetical protein F0562_004833 [Nyssa sinensis]|uniref:COP9 signalosome complex subunit 3 n=1 Tax=Nyssa sinensis TaxID=561372 RepID=A0A5J5AIS1_9ASTE|nr:hypothetical protein F0562_004833 [Nyssa sinensis]